MSARDDLIEIVARDDRSSGGDVVWARDLVDAHRAEVLAEAPAVENYPGELAMLRGLLGVVRAIAEYADIDELRRVLAEYDTDAHAAYEEKAVPDLTARQLWLLAEIRAKGGRWKSGTVRTAYRLGRFGSVARSRCSRDLQSLHAAGHLHQIDEDGVRYYVLKDGA